MSQWNRPYVFTRSSNIYTFSRNPLPQKNNYSHIYMPWTEEIVHDLLFKVKSEISESGSCVIPFMDCELNRIGLTNEELIQFEKQLSFGVETHLVMSNMDSIHMLKVRSVLTSKELKKNKEIAKLSIFEDKDQFQFWIEVDDLFVYRANHSGTAELVESDLEALVNDEQNQNFFVPIQQLNIYDSHKSDDLRAQALKWTELNRNLTYDYFIRSCELEENIYQDTWKDLSRRTQHCLIMTEQLRHKGILYKDQEKLNFFKDSFESYLSALINELNEVYIGPLNKVYHGYESLQDVWKGLQEGLVHPELRTIMTHLFEHSDNQIATLETFLIYMNNAKTCLFSMKHKYEKKIGKEEYLLMENFLTRQENLIELFLCKKLDKKLESIIEVKNWLQYIMDSKESLSLIEIKDCTLKLSHLLTIMTSASYKDNLFFQLTEQKTLRGVVRKSFEEEVRDLNKLYLKKVA